MTDTIRHLRPIDPDNPEPYPWPAEFERSLLHACVYHPRFWSLIGTHLEAESLRERRGVEILRACSAIARESGEGPSNPLLVLRRIQARVEEGALRSSDFDQIAAMLDEVEDRGDVVGSLDQLVAEAAEVVRRRQRDQVLSDMTLAAGKGKPLTRYAAEIEAVEKIGKESATGSVSLSRSVWGGIEELRRASRLATGINQLDDALGGGVFPKTLTVIGADQNVGKTAMMVHIACFNWLAGKRIIYVPTEESVPSTMVRIISWITGHSMEDVSKSTPASKSALDRMLAVPSVGAIACEYLPQGSPVSKLRALIDQALEDHPEFGGGFDVLLVDYADKLSGTGREKNLYEAMGTVYEGLRQIAVDYGNWVVTGSQLKDRQGKKQPTAQDLRDSRRKGDIADAVILIDRPEDAPDERSYIVGKNRGPGSGRTIGPIPTDLDIGRIAPVGRGGDLLA